MKIVLTSMPMDGQVRDYTTPKFYQPKAVKYMPLGILSVAAGISDSHEVIVLDPSSSGMSIADTCGVINELGPDVLGMSVVTHRAYAMAEILRRTDVPHKAVGGPHATHYSDEILKLGADAVFIHDGDVNFGRWIDQGWEPGVYSDYIGNLDSLPFPRRDLLDIADYTIDSSEAGGTIMKKAGVRLPVSSSKGCPYRCVFCDVQEKRFRWKSSPYLIDEIESALPLGVDSIHILADNFNVRRNRVLGICEEVVWRGLKFQWSARGRVTLDREVAEALVAAGCKRLHVGVESLDPEVLRFMNKGLTVDAILEFFKLCVEYGIETVAYFILGSPMETSEYRKSLPSRIRDMGVTYPFFNVLYPLSNTEYYRSLVADGTFDRDYWADFAANPTPGYELPLPRSPDLQVELEDTVNEYINEFYISHGVE